MDNPRISQLLQQRDDRFVAVAIVIIAVELFEQGREEANPQLALKLGTFGLRVARHLRLDKIASLPKQAS